MRKRMAAGEDIPALVELRKRQLIDEGMAPVSSVDRQFTDYFTTALANGTFISWIVENDGEIIATSGICFYTLPPTFPNPTGRIAYITNMYTRPEYRRGGIATELLSMLITEAKNREYKIIRLHTSEYGKSIYEKAGFTDTDGFMALRF